MSTVRRVATRTLSACCFIAIASCAAAGSPIYRELQAAAGAGTVGLVVLDGETARDDRAPVEQIVDDLMTDGFALDLGDVSRRPNTTCGRLVLPYGDTAIFLRKRGNIIDGRRYIVLITIDRQCRVEGIQGSVLAPASL